MNLIVLKLFEMYHVIFSVFPIVFLQIYRINKKNYYFDMKYSIHELFSIDLRKLSSIEIFFSLDVAKNFHMIVPLDNRPATQHSS